MLATVFVGLVPMPFHSVHSAVVWLPDEAIVRAEAAGQVQQVLLAADAMAQPGQVLLTLDSPRATADLAIAAAAVAQGQAQLRKAEVDEPVRAEPLRAELASRTARLIDAERRVQSLAIKAVAPGTWTPAAPTELEGRYVKRGEVVGFIVPGPSALVRTVVTQEDMDLIRSRLRGVEVRMVNDMSDPVPARVTRHAAGGGFDLVSSALGTSGGGEIAVDPSQQGGTRSLKRVFDIELVLERPSHAPVFGDRAHVRFDLGPAPLAWQWYLRLRQLFLSQLNL